MSALVSIVIANYNYGRFLEEAICSVLEQSCQDFELIVCDAASKDNSDMCFNPLGVRVTIPMFIVACLLIRAVRMGRLQIPYAMQKEVIWG